MNYGDTLNSKNIFTEFGVSIFHGRENLLKLNERKAVNTVDFADIDGSAYDIDESRVKDSEVVLNCVFSPEETDEFWQKHEKFMLELSKPGWQKLFIKDHNKTYQVFYLRTENMNNKTKRFEGVERVFIRFDLVLKVQPIYRFSWKRHTELFTAEYKMQYNGSFFLAEHQNAVHSSQNLRIAQMLLNNRLNVILKPKIYKEVNAGSGVWLKQTDAEINGKPAEIYALKNDMNVTNLFRAIRSTYKKKPQIIVVNYPNGSMPVNQQMEYAEAALKRFREIVGSASFQQLWLIDNNGTLLKKNVNVKKINPVSRVYGEALRLLPQRKFKKNDL